MKLRRLIAAFLLAVSAVPAGVAAQNVYRCGNAYSQKPCSDGVAVDVQDKRTPEQKAESDALIKRDSAAANAMEKTRLKEEAQQRANNARLAAAMANKATAKEKGEPVDGTASTQEIKAKKKSANKKKEPDFYPTRVTPTKPKKAASASK
jgi:hypothetical protein